MRRLLGCVVVLLLGGVAGSSLAPAAAPPVRTKGKAVELPHLRFRHTDVERRTRTFVLDGASGTVDYYPGGKRRKDKLVFVRPATLGSLPGWVYQVEREGKKRPVWFYFATRPTIQRGGKKLYLVLFTLRPPDARGKQWWQPLPPPLGAVATPLAKEKAADV
jgi:hypothetical protein